ncbi:MAG: hypothetical protein RBS23_09860, partial [Mariniphaga sp.]|nr:hypothetical protein [Mariniphaga sp.]
MKRLAYILLMMFLVAAQAAAQDVNVVDVVCQKSERTYRIDGEEDSVWEWKLEFEEDDGTITEVVPMLFEANDFSEERNGDYIWGSEITILWDLSSGSLDPGIYNLSVEQTSIHGCINHQFGQIEVIPAPTAFAGNDMTVCATDVVFLENATAKNYLSLMWIAPTESGGTFSDLEALNPTYYPSENDIENGEVELWLVALSDSPTGGCDEAVSVIKITLLSPQLVITSPDAVCEPGAVDLTDEKITAGSDDDLTFTYWEDEDMTEALGNPEGVSQAGTYYIRAEAQNGCYAVETVEVTIYPAPDTPDLVVTQPDCTVQTGSIEVTAPLGTEYTYSIDGEDFQTEVSFADLTPGDYSITVMDENGCTAKEDVTIDVIPGLPQLVITSPDAVCEPAAVDLTDEEITAGSDDDLTFTYWEDEDMTEALGNPEGVSQAGTYYIRAEAQNGCYAVETVEVTIYPAPDTPDLVVTQPDCT